MVAGGAAVGQRALEPREIAGLAAERRREPAGEVGQKPSPIRLQRAADTQVHGLIHAAEPSVDQKVRRSEEHTSELQSLMRSSYAVFCLQKKKHILTPNTHLCHISN